MYAMSSLAHYPLSTESRFIIWWSRKRNGKIFEAVFNDLFYKDYEKYQNNPFPHILNLET